MAKEALKGALEQGAEVEFVRLLDLKLKPCNGCNACTMSLMKGGPGNCVIQDDDFDWLDEKVLDADGVVFAMPVFEKGAPGVFNIIHDRMFGPSHDLGIVDYGQRIAEKSGASGPLASSKTRKLNFNQLSSRLMKSSGSSNSIWPAEFPSTSASTQRIVTGL